MHKPVFLLVALMLVAAIGGAYLGLPAGASAASTQSVALATPSVRQATPDPPAPSAIPVEPTIEPMPEPAPTVQPEPGGPPVANPQRIQIPAIEVDAEVEYVGLTAEQAMEAPKDPAKVAWYKDGPKPGEKGNSPIGGHVDWGGSLQVFGLLKTLGPGDVVTVTAEDGRKFDFVVQWSRSFDYDVGGAALGEIFGSSDKPELTLITCGGAFDRATHNYLERLVVRAVMR